MSLSMKKLREMQQERAERAERPDINWFSFKEAKKGANGYARKLVFLQELDEDAPKYSQARGRAIYVQEHAPNHHFPVKFECTMDSEGRCYGCDMNQEEPKVTLPSKKGDEPIVYNYPWRAKTNFYVNVWTDKDRVEVLSRPWGGAVYNFLDEYSKEELDGNVTGVTWNVTKGFNQSDSWVFATSNKGLEVPEDVELIDLEKYVVRKVKYEDQRALFGKSVPADSSNDEETKSVSTTEDVDW